MALERKIQKLNDRIEMAQKALERIFTYRLLTALAVFLNLALFSLGIRHAFLLLTLAAGIAIFIFWVSLTGKIRRHQRRLQVLAKFFERQRSRILGLPPETFQPEIEPTGIAIDLDFFGSHSLASQIDETFTDGGHRLLMDEMMRPSRNSDQIQARQNSVKALANYAGFFRRLVVAARADVSLRTDSLSDQNVGQSFLDTDFTRRYLILRILCALYLFSAIATLVFSIPLPIGAIWFAYFVTSMALLNKYAESFSKIQSLSLQMETLIPIFRQLERGSSAFQKNYVPSLEGSPFSQSLKRLNQQASLISIQTHPLVNVLFNGIVPWNFYFLLRAERLRARIESRWNFAVRDLHNLEVLGSLATMLKYQMTSFPEVAEVTAFEAVGLRHPLIQQGKSVSNDFTLNQSKRLILITGSNMSGKSTFLRTIGLNQTLALMGAPVYAKKFKTSSKPVKSCIRVSDSVRDGVSYFYAETLRLKDVLKDAGEGALYLIDEMFRGTNNKERLIGSQGVITALLETDSIGFVSTHDLELALLEKNHSKLENWHFRDDIDESGIRFSYKIHPGPCPTTNALKIMRSLGLPVPPN